MTKEEFQDLLQRYNSGNCTGPEIEKINDWFTQIANENLALHEEERKQVGKRMYDTLSHHLPSATKRKIPTHTFTILKVAASLVILLLVVYFINKTPGLLHEDLAQHHSSTDVIKYKNSASGILKIQLPDSSTVELQPNAEISYSKKWDAPKREVHLVGEGFFNVVKNSSRPFYVYGGDIVTKVLGTSFSIKAAANAESIEVAVHTGKVSVYEGHQESSNIQHGSDASGVLLTPNEKVEFFVHDKHWVTSLVENPKPIPASNKAVAFVFNSTPMREVIENIEQTYSIGIIMENEASYSCSFTGDVSMMELYDMLEVICKSTGTNYEVKGTKILITGRGCE